MIVLGIESTAHTFGIGITDGSKILCNEKDVYVPKEGWGIVPGEASKHHDQKAQKVLEKALKSSRVSLDEVDFIALSTGPGLPPCLLSGLRFAKSLDKKIIPVNHCYAHIEIGKFDTGCKDPLIVYVSGGNTQIIGLEGGMYRIFGETLDIGIGNAIDKFARNAGLQSPGGPHIEKLARRGKNYIELPYTVKGMDLVFSGLVTSASEKIGRQNKIDSNLVYSFQETIFSMLVEVTERALAHTKKSEVLLIGGVAQNKRLQEMLKDMCKKHDAKFFVPKSEYCADNGAMIAWAGFLSKKPEKELDINPKWRTDEVEITWKSRH